MRDGGVFPADLHPIRHDQPRHTIYRSICIPRQIKPLWQPDLCHQQEDWRGDDAEAGFRPSRHGAGFWNQKSTSWVFSKASDIFTLSFESYTPYIFTRQEVTMAHPRNLAPAPDRNAVLTKAMLRAAERLGLSGRQLAEIVGVSEATVSRLKRGEATLEAGSKPFELAALLVRAFRSLDAITGGDEAVARVWMTAANSALAARPIERMATVQGLVDVTTYLDARRAPV